jgi:HlyD family secretion protein
MTPTDLLAQQKKGETALPPRSGALAEPSVPPKRAKSRKWRWVILVALVACAAAVTIYYTRSTNAVEYQAVAVDRGDIVAAVTATGTCNAVVTVQVGSQVSGNILALYADFNTKVKRGQVVARIDPAIFQARVDQATANLESAKVSVVNARAGVKKAEADIANAEANGATQRANVIKAESAVTDARTKNARRIDLVKQGIIAQEDADTAQSTYDQAVANLEAAKAAVTAALSSVESAKASREVAETLLDANLAAVKQFTAALKQAQLDLDHTEIVAPVDGTVISRNMDVGQTVAASFQAPTIFQIAQDLTKMEVDTNVDEADVAPIRVGQNTTFTVDAYPGTAFHGEVVQIRKAPINVQNVITYNVVVGFSNTDLKIFPGMTANVKIVTGRADQALRVPSAALRFRPSGAQTQPQAGRGQMGGKARSGALQGTQTLYVLDGKVPKPAKVRAGISDGNFLEILDGLTEGQKVITGTVSKGTAAAPATQTAPTTPRRFGI